MAKRKAKELGDGDGDGPRRSSRRRTSAKDEAEPDMEEVSKSMKKKKPAGAHGKKKDEAGTINGSRDESKDEKPKDPESSKSTSTSTNTESKNAANTSTPPPPGRQYWLMKAEPESRLENGHDIKFSIDDLAAKTEPEPWDGIRAYAARNNLRAMKKGDLAFFYHSSCKVPAIVGIMEIVKEHSPDLSAHDPNTPYYDPKSSPSSPKWSLVHVSFRQKLRTPITLKELKAWHQQKGHPLQDMQMLRMTRMSVSSVSAEEWDFLVGEMRGRGDEVEC